MIPLILLLACGTGRDALTWQESWELLAIQTDRSLLDARFTRSNTGLIRGQGHVRLDQVAPREVPILYGRDALPRETLDVGAISIGPDQLIQNGDSWELTIRSGEVDVRITLDSDSTFHSPHPIQRNGWEVEALVTNSTVQGFIRAGDRSSLIQGRGVILHRKGSRPPGLKGTHRLSAFVVDNHVSLGIDQTGADALAWAYGNGRSWTSDTALIRRLEGGVVEMDYRPGAPILARLLPASPHHRRRTWAHLSGMEQWLLGLLHGQAERRIRGAIAEVLIEDQLHKATGMIAVVDYR